MTGRVKSYNPQKGYGFVTSDGQDYFIHAKDWEYRLPPTEGLKISFVPRQTDKGLRATQIRRKGEAK